MEVNIAPGKYVVAVSGGVDSMVLLDLLVKKTGLELVVAHFDHGIRPDSAKDAVFVKKQAGKRGLVFETAKGQLGLSASEATARQARYAFLEEIRSKHNAQAIITAHHQDDMVETAIINILRGTNWRGINSLSSSFKLLRPMLHITKGKIQKYAKTHKLEWVEDKTNDDDKYLRNYVRKNIMSRLGQKDRQTLISKIDKVAKDKLELESLIATISHSTSKNNLIDRRFFASLPLRVETELVTDRLRQAEVKSYDRNLINRLTMAIKSGPKEATMPVKDDLNLMLTKETAAFVRTDQAN